MKHLTLEHCGLLVIMMFFSISLKAQITVEITGPTTAAVGQTKSYSVIWRNGGNTTSPLTTGTFSWYVQNGTTSSASNAGIDILWTHDGSQWMIFEYNTPTNYYYDTNDVAVGDIPPSTPNTTYSTSRNCNTTVVTRTASPPAGVTWYWQTTSYGLSTTLGSGSQITITEATPLYLRAKNVTGSWSGAQSVGNITILAAPPAAPTTAYDKDALSNTAISVPLSVSAVSEATGYRWYTTSTGGSSISGPVTTSYSPFISATTTFYVASVIDGCSSTSRTAVTGYVYPAPVISTTDNGVTTLGSNVTLSLNYVYSQYQWKRGGVAIAGATSATHTTNQPGIYTVSVSKGNSSTVTSNAFTITNNYISNRPNLNYIISETIQMEGLTNINNIGEFYIEDNQQSFQYFDGLGRPVQSVITQGSPLKRDLVQATAYDNYGRESIKYLPYTSTENTGFFKTTFKAKNESGYNSSPQYQFYNNSSTTIAQDTRPFAETVFETSPLNRPLQTYGAGVNWKNGTTVDKPVQYQYLSNSHGTGVSTTQEKIIAWQLDANDLPVRKTPVTGAIVTGGYYSGSQLNIHGSVDEQGNAVREYTNKSGQVVLKKVQGVAPSVNLNSTTDWALTYYLYDDFGNLRYVFQPELSKAIHNAADGYVVTATQLNNFAFQYKYDARKRMTQKRVPGADWVYMVYDNRDRLVMTQDGNQRTGAAKTIKYWTFTKYDELNRPILTGIKDTTIASATEMFTQADMQAVVDQYYSLMATTKPWRKWGETFVGASDANNVHGYTNKSYPQVTTAAISDVNSYLTVTYYDNYTFRDDWQGTYTYVSDELTQTENGHAYTQPGTNNENKNVIGQVTGSKVKVLDGGVRGGYTWLKTINYFDDKYRPIQIQTDNYKGGKDQISNLYDFVGKTLMVKETHTESDITWKDQIGATLAGNKLLRTVTGNTWTASGAASVQQLAAGQDGWLEVTVSETTTNKMIGLADTNPDVGYDNIDYAFYLHTTSLLVYENGVSKKTITGGIKPGDVLRIERTGTAIKYYRNEVEVYPAGVVVTQIPSSTILMVDASLNTSACSLVGVRTSFSTTGKTITRHFDYDHAGRLISTYHKLGDGTTITWTSLIGTNITDNQLTNTGTSWNAGALSHEFIPANTDGWLEFPAYEIGKSKMIGLSEPDATTKYQTIDYAVYLNSSTLYIYENGVSKGSFGTFNVNDLFRIERKQGVVSYYKNGTVFYTSASLSGIALYADCSFNTAGGHLSSVFIGTGVGSSEIEIVHNDYNELGQLVDKKLHSANGTLAKQSVDYRYNIRGWLTSVNNAALTSDNNVTNDDTNDYFGMSLSYDKVDTDLGNSQLYNGNISGMKWSNYPGTGTTKQKGYIYTYDPMSRITGSTYREKGTAWSSLANSAFAETGFSYDLNGNIQTLTRNDKRSTGSVMDVLTYNYGATTTLSNKLLKVTDAGDKNTGFVDCTTNGVNNDYTYDSNGNMLTDQNKGITTAITYNYLNLPILVSKGGNSVQYIYDATGRKLSQVTNFGGRTKQTDYAGEFVYENDALQFINHEEGRIVTSNTTLVYTNSCDATTDITSVNSTLTPVTLNGIEKYVQVTSNSTVARSGVFPIGNTYPVNEGERYLIRVKGYRTGTNPAYIAVKVNGTDVNWPGATLPSSALTESWVEQTVTIPTGATMMEVGVTWNTVTNNESMFLNEVEITKLSDTTPEYQYNLKDHLGNVRITFTTKQETELALATLEAANADDERSKFVRYDNARLVKNYLFDHTNGSSPTTVEGAAQRLSGQGNEIYGLGRSISVMPGDVINMEVYAKYIDKTTANLTPALATLLGQIATGTAGGVVIDGSSYISSTSSFPFPAYEQSNTSSSTGTGPKAYLSWLVFDRDNNLLLSKTGYKRLSATPKENGQDIAHEKLSGTVTITEPGYVYVFVSNEEGVNAYEVYFDDLRVTQAKSPVIASNDYYPFGLTFNSYSRENSFKQDYQYNSNELQDELNLGWLDYGARMYEPSIGRWMAVDPLADMARRWSPYTYCNNNPIWFIDPDGMEVKNGYQDERDEALNDRNAKQEDFNNKYSGNKDLKRGDFSSRKEFKSYKSDKASLVNAESTYQSAEANYTATQEYIDNFKSVDSEGFAQVDNLKNAHTNSKIDVIVKFDQAMDPNTGGGSTAPTAWPKGYDNQELGGDGNINITIGPSKFSKGELIAHEFGHAVGIANDPYLTYQSVRAAVLLHRAGIAPASCQLPENRNELHVKTAMDWQERFNQLIKK